VRVLKVFRVACFVVTVVAGLAGTVMLITPDNTDAYFSWPIGPPPLAALVGAFYLASALTFSLIAMKADWPAARGICFGILAFTLPTLAATVRHRDLFEWDRGQALAWIALFAGSPLAFSSFLYLLRARAPHGREGLPSSTKAILGLLVVVYGALGLGLLLAPGRLQDGSPFALPGLSGRFLGSWCLFLSVVAGFALVRNRAHEARIPVFALVAWPVAATLAAVRSFDELRSDRRAGYIVLVVALAALAMAAAGGVAQGDRAQRAGSPPRPDRPGRQSRLTAFLSPRYRTSPSGPRFSAHSSSRSRSASNDIRGTAYPPEAAMRVTSTSMTERVPRRAGKRLTRSSPARGAVATENTCWLRRRLVMRSCSTS
jgi:hypothetical protein